MTIHRHQPRGEARIRSGHPWVYRSDRRGARRAATSSRSRARATATLGYAPLQRPIGDRAAHADASGEAPTLDLWRARWTRRRYRESLGIDATAYRLVHGEADRLPGWSSIATATIWCSRRSSQGIDRLLPEITLCSSSACKPAGILARNDPRVRLLEGWSRAWRCSRRGARRIEVREGRVEYQVDPITGRRPVCSSTSARTAWRRALRARPRARRVQLQRRIRAGAGAGLRRSDCRRHLGGRRRAHRGERRAERHHQRRAPWR